MTSAPVLTPSVSTPDYQDQRGPASEPPSPISVQCEVTIISPPHFIGLNLPGWRHNFYCPLSKFMTIEKMHGFLLEHYPASFPSSSTTNEQITIDRTRHEAIKGRRYYFQDGAMTVIYRRFYEDYAHGLLGRASNDYTCDFLFSLRFMDSDLEGNTKLEREAVEEEKGVSESDPGPLSVSGLSKLKCMPEDDRNGIGTDRNQSKHTFQKVGKQAVSRNQRATNKRLTFRLLQSKMRARTFNRTIGPTNPNNN
ncbi:hypothetical protein EJ04DRAFT_521244 [Polyplosphaeria fusca]|uniref:Uncharacterized protein n=1 Tax=Polyplosphaeria fusca TaxID=682080 RepID=A0A9P4V5G4_9PLEO|nr:hypothetical protein EJ04DRAFT_521244 [Polyplosphaeria fusca]